MKIHLTDHFDYRRLLRFSLSAIIMIIRTSIYCIVNGFFDLNIVRKSVFAPINLIMPVLIGVGSIGFIITNLCALQEMTISLLMESSCM